MKTFHGWQQKYLQYTKIYSDQSRRQKVSLGKFWRVSPVGITGITGITGDVVKLHPRAKVFHYPDSQRGYTWSFDEGLEYR